MSAKILQPERKGNFKPPKKPADFSIRARQIHKRATVESRKGHSRIATVALSHARSAPFRAVFGLWNVSIKIKQLIINVLKVSPKLPIYARVGCPLQILQAEKLKMNK